jgi:hypothetical protein
VIATPRTTGSRPHGLRGIESWLVTDAHRLARQRALHYVRRWQRWSASRAHAPALSATFFMLGLCAAS